MTRWLGLRCAYITLVPVAFYFMLFAPTARRSSRLYRNRFMPDHTSWLRLLVDDYLHFFSFGRILLDRISKLADPKSPIQFTVAGQDNISDALAVGCGAVILSAHCGNWEAASHCLASNTAVPVNIVMYEAHNGPMRQLHDNLQGNPKFRVINAGEGEQTSLHIIAALQRGEIVVMHGDRSMNDSTVTVDFLGDVARFPMGPHMVSAITGAPLIHVFSMREELYRYKIIVDKPLQLHFTAREHREDELKEWVGNYACRLEEILHKYPFQWHNFYDFWEDGSSGKSHHTLTNRLVNTEVAGVL